MKKTLSLIVLALCFIAAPAYANSFSDPDDMTSPLDIRELVHKDKGGDVHAFKVTTDGNWRCRYLEPGLTKIHFYFDGKGDGDTDLVGKTRCLKYTGGRDLVLFLSGDRNSYEPVPINKPTRHTMRFKFPFNIPELRGEHVDVHIKVEDGVAEGCTSAHPCTERAPDNGRWRLY